MFFFKIYQKFSKISAVGLVIISAFFVLCVMCPVPVKLGIFSRQFRISRHKTRLLGNSV